MKSNVKEIIISRDEHETTSTYFLQHRMYINSDGNTTKEIILSADKAELYNNFLSNKYKSFKHYTRAVDELGGVRITKSKNVYRIGTFKRGV